MQVTFNPHVKKDVEIVSRILGLSAQQAQEKKEPAKGGENPLYTSVLGLVGAGIQRPGQIRKRLGISTENLSYVARKLILSGKLRATGRTSNRLFHLK
jgi:hypothetical protein